MIFDTHAHYDDGQFDEDRDQVIRGLRDAGVGAFVDVCANIDSFKQVLPIAEKYPFAYGAVGVHPDDAGKLTDEWFEKIEAASHHEKCVAIGEIGLDYYWNKSEKDIQEQAFRRQIDLARRTGKPFIVHSRDAAADTLRVIKDERAGEVGGVIHCFSYEVEMAREYLNMGFFLGIGGVLTFKNSRKLKEVVEYAPVEQLVVETDCPYLAPVPLRGSRNYSGNIKYVLDEMARIKGIDREEIEEITWNNARRLYRLQG